MNNPVRDLWTGNWIMALCGCFYLAWWIIVFKPPKPRNSPAGLVLLALAFLAGIVGVYLMVKSLMTPIQETRPGMISSFKIMITGAVVYALLLILTVRFFHRQVTSELLIIIAWAVLEFCAVNFLYRCDNMNIITALLLAGIIFMAVLGGLICYILYYRLPYTESFIDGCVPLILAVLTIALINITAARAI